jgi:hypothetical protein
MKIERDFVNKALKSLPKDPNEMSRWVCQEMFFRSLPSSAFSKIIPTIIVSNRSLASSLFAYVNLKRIQDRNIRIIHESNFARLSPDFDAVIVESHTPRMSAFISWLYQSKYFSPQLVRFFRRSSLINFHPVDCTWHLFTPNWMYADVTFDINALKQPDSSNLKFQEEIESDENG